MNKDSYGDLPTRTKAAWEDLYSKQEMVLQNPGADTFEAVSDALEVWHHLAGIEEQFFRQKSHIQWLRFGDQNTSFFHIVAQGRASRNSIKKLVTEEGVVLTEIDKLKKEASSYYKRFLQGSPEGYEGCQ